MYEILDRIPFKLDFDRIMKSLRLRKNNPLIEEMVSELIADANRVARPKAAYKISAVENKDNDTLEIDSVKFTSHIMRINFNGLNRVFPYIATCGQEVDALKYPQEDVLKSFYMDIIRLNLLNQANVYLTGYIKKRFDLRQIAHMNPGSLADWPLSQQKPLFSLFPNIEKEIGVRLTDNNLMQPLKSISGILFDTEVEYENCQLCPREKCSFRRSPYKSELIKKYAYIKTH
jgi:acyl carrier protein